MRVNFSIPEFATERLRLHLPKLSDLPTINDFRVSERSRESFTHSEIGTLDIWVHATDGALT